MTLHLIYFSPGGTTKRTVKNIASGISDDIIEHDMMNEENRKHPLNFGNNDLVILAMPTATKLFGFPEEIISLLKGDSTPIVCVVLYGNGYYANSLKLMKKAVEKKGFKTVAAGAFIGQNSYNKNVATGRPDEKDKAIQVRFGEAIFEKIYIKKDLTLNSKLKTDWAKNDFVSAVKAAVIMQLPQISTRLPESFCQYRINQNCIECKKCEKICPVGAINISKKYVDPKKCIGCFACANTCPKDAIDYTHKGLKKIVENVGKKRTQRREPEIFL